jgi:hypothetical protein
LLYAGQTLFELLQATKVNTKIASITPVMIFFLTLILISGFAEIKIVKKLERKCSYPLFSACSAGTSFT